MQIQQIVFWGNIGVHLYPLAVALSKKIHVFIVMDSVDYEQGRQERLCKYVPTSSLTIIDYRQYETIDDIISIFDNRTTVHINGSFKLTKSFTSEALRLLLKHKAVIFSLPQEGFQFQGLKKVINTLKWYIYINVMFRRVKGFGLTGDNAFRDFRMIRCNMDRCFPFMYVTEPFYRKKLQTNEVYKVIFVGAIDERKNIRPIVETLINHPFARPYEFHIYGGYGDVDKLNALIRHAPNFVYHGLVSNEEVRKAMSESDLLILPSLYDGYGAVVNEGLQCGCKILVSNKCGSEFLIRSNPQLGRVFDVGNLKDFRNQFATILAEGPLSNQQKEKIVRWSELHISPSVIADYCMAVLDFFVNDRKDNFPRLPWIDVSDALNTH